jgi:hypothetical protein
MKSYIKKIGLLLISTVLYIHLFAQSTIEPSAKIEPALLKQDFTQLKDSLQNLHPGLYRYKSKAETDKLFELDYRKLDQALTEVDFFAIVSHFISNMEDGHTECFLPKDFINKIINGVKLFPLQPRYIGNKAYVPCNTKDFEAGTEIIAINDEPAERIRKQMFSLLSSDGAIETEKYVKINDGHDPFSYLYYVLYGEKADFKVTYRTADGKTGNKTIAANYFGKMECPPPHAKIEQYLSLAYPQDGLAIMTLKTFANEYLESTKENFTDFLATSFKALNEKKISKLVIDLRENGGGEDTNGLLLYRYLSDKPFRYYASLNSTKKQETGHPNLALQKPMNDSFKGKVEFLISGKSFSGAAEFSAVAKNNNRGIFIGEETGGGYYGNTSGSKIALILPNSKIRVNIPLVKYVMAVKPVKEKDRGVIPDYIVTPTIENYINQQDVQMKLAIKLANQK